MIEIDGLVHGILTIPSLRVAEGHTALIGPNGSGKSTFLSLLSGIEVPLQGRIAIDGRPPRQVDVGWVPEFPDQSILFTRVDDEIAGPSRFAGLPCGEVERRVDAAARLVGIEDLLPRTVRELSGGERALVALATALSTDPEVLVLDEFDSHLDGETAEVVEEALSRCRCRYSVRCTQDMAAAARADTVLYLEKGRVGEIGTPAAVFAAREETCFYPPLWRIARGRQA